MKLPEVYGDYKEFKISNPNALSEETLNEFSERITELLQQVSGEDYVLVLHKISKSTFTVIRYVHFICRVVFVSVHVLHSHS